MNTFYESFHKNEITSSKRVLPTPSQFAKSNLFYVQETGTLRSLKSHKCSRKHLDSFLFLIVISGKGIVSKNNKTYALAVNDCILIDCNLPYSHQSSEDNPWELMWVHFNGEKAKSYYGYFTDKSPSGLFHVDNPNDFIFPINKLMEVNETKQALSEILSSKYITDILTLCFTISDLHDKNKTTYQKLEVIKEYIHQNFQYKLSLDEISELFYISKFHLSREFKEAFGITIGNYILAQRISFAKELLRFSNRSISSIATACGIPDTSYFNKVFKKSENMTASAYRKNWSHRS